MKKLTLDKGTITKLNSQKVVEVKGGNAAFVKAEFNAWGKCEATSGCDSFTGGCTDGCFFSTWGNCTSGHCTADCPEHIEKTATSR